MAAAPVMIFIPMLIAGLTIVGLFLLLLVLIRIATSPREKRHRQTDTTETRMIQELHNGFERMDQRVEALETILMDQIKNRQERETSAEWK